MGSFIDRLQAHADDGQPDQVGDRERLGSREEEGDHRQGDARRQGTSTSTPICMNCSTRAIHATRSSSTNRYFPRKTPRHSRRRSSRTARRKSSRRVALASACPTCALGARCRSPAPARASDSTYFVHRQHAHDQRQPATSRKLQRTTRRRRRAGRHAMKQIKGVVTGVVKEIDPALGAVKVDFSWMQPPQRSNWAPIATVMSGNGRGMYYMPEIDDEALIAVRPGRIRSSLRGRLHVERCQKTSETATEIRVSKTPCGHLIAFEVKDDVMKIVYLAIRSTKPDAGDNPVASAASRANSRQPRLHGNMIVQLAGATAGRIVVGFPATLSATLQPSMSISAPNVTINGRLHRRRVTSTSARRSAPAPDSTTSPRIRDITAWSPSTARFPRASSCQCWATRSPNPIVNPLLAPGWQPPVSRSC